MTHVTTERAQDMIVRLWAAEEKGGPGGLYHEAGEVIADLAEAWAAALEIIAALRRKLDLAA